MAKRKGKSSNGWSVLLLPFLIAVGVILMIRNKPDDNNDVVENMSKWVWKTPILFVGALFILFGVLLLFASPKQIGANDANQVILYFIMFIAMLMYFTFLA